MPIQVALKRIIINEIEDDQVVILQELEGERSLPIVIGLFEASSIERRVKGLQPPRPLTHDLIINAVETLGGELYDVIIRELKEHTYYALLRIRQSGELIELDCRPSDAIAVAVTGNLPIFVNEQVFGDSED